MALTAAERAEIAAIRMALLCVAASNVAVRDVVVRLMENPNLLFSPEDKAANLDAIKKSIGEINDFLKAVKDIKYSGGPDD